MPVLTVRKTYYGNGSVKSVYYLDQSGQMQGEYIEYELGTNKVIKRQNWVEGKCRYSQEISPTGKIIETFYDELGRPTKVDHDGHTVKDFKDGLPFNGPHNLEWKIQNGNAVCNEAGLYKDGKKQGIFVFKCNQGGYGNSKEEVSYVNGILQGRYFGQNCTRLLTQETAYIPELVDTDFFAMNAFIQEGVKATGVFDKGLFTGEVREYDKEFLSFKNGKMVHAEKHDEPEGDQTWDCVYKDNYLVSIKHVIKGRDTLVHDIKVDGECTLTRNRIIVEKYTNKNGQKNGLYQKFNNKGKLEEEAQYQNNELNGIRKIYNNNGLLMVEAEYKNNKINGIYKEYRNGSLITKYFQNNIDYTDDYLAKHKSFPVNKNNL